MISELLIKRLRNEIEAVDERVYGAPTFIQAMQSEDLVTTYPCIYVVDERDSVEPIVGGNVTYQSVTTDVDIAVAISRIDKNLDDKDLQYLRDLKTIKDQLFAAILNWGISPQNSQDRDEDGQLENISDHGPFLWNYKGAETLLSRTASLFHVFTFGITYMVDGGCTPEGEYANLEEILNEINDADGNRLETVSFTEEGIETVEEE